MKRQHRTVVVVAVALVMATLASFAIYRTVQRLPVRQVEVASVRLVVAKESIPVGTMLEAKHLKLVPWPAANRVPGAFSDLKDVIGRGAIAPVVPNEPFTAANVADPASGAGLPPIIPAGMRAISVRVNEIIGVAGFVVPGTRVDVVVTVNRSGGGSADQAMTRTVVSNVRVLTAGTRFDQAQSKDGKPIPTSVVTLMVLPEDAERIALAQNEGKLTLALRNPLDVEPTATSGIKLAALMSPPGAQPVIEPVRNRVVARKVVAPPPPPPVPQIYRVETIRAAKRGEEEVNP